MMDAERFWSKVDQCGACWLWTGTRDGDGCDVFNFKGRPYLAHRTAYALTHGEIPPGLVVMHSCDNRWRVNPAHLRVGTQTENVEICTRRDGGRRSTRRTSIRSYMAPQTDRSAYGMARNISRMTHQPLWEWY